MKLEFVIGVTGHRDISVDDNTYVKESFKNYISNINKSHPNIIIRVLTGLAVGADRLVAAEILELNNPHILCTGVLPLKASEYLNDFDEGEKKEFQELLRLFKERSFEIVELTENSSRPECYQNLGTYILNKSDVLVSIWDMNKVEGLGGTYDITRLAYDNNSYTKANDFYGYEKKPVYVIPCNRENKNSLKFERQPGYLINIEDKCLGKEPNSLIFTLSQLSSFQDEISNYDLKTAQIYAPTEQLDSYISSDADRLSKYFGVFDLLANQSQKKVNFFHISLAYLTFFIACTFLVYAKLFPEKFILGLYLGLFVFGFTSFKLLTPNKRKEDYALFRLISESLRLEFFMIQSGVVDSLGNKSISTFLNTRGSKFDQAIKSVLRQASTLGGTSKSKENAKEALLDWFLNQHSYYKKSYSRLHNKHHKIEKLVKASIYLPIILLSIVLFPSIYYSLKSIFILGVSGKVWAVFISALIPVIGLVFEQLALNSSIKEHMQFSFQKVIFLENVIKKINSLPDDSSYDEIAMIASQELSEEHNLWLNITNMKTLTTAHGG
jgi:hypothetical protein